MDAIKIIQANGSTPDPRFGHSITQYAQGKYCMFGGAVGQVNNYSMSNQLYSLSMPNFTWKKIQSTGPKPSKRAAHAVVCVQKNKLLLYGGVAQGGVLASDQLYFLDIKQGVGIWNIVNTGIKTAGKRYAHSMVYLRPYIIIFGGITDNGQQANNNIWILNIEQKPFKWQQIKITNNSPCPRSYHSMIVSTTGSTKGLIILYGGRSKQKRILNDCWGLRKRSNGNWQWQQAPLQNKQQLIQRFQHNTIFIDTLLLIIGGKKQGNNQKISAQIINMQTNIITYFDLAVRRCRFISWIFQNQLYINGGIQFYNTHQQISNQTISINLSQLININKINTNRYSLNNINNNNTNIKLLQSKSAQSSPMPKPPLPNRSISPIGLQKQKSMPSPIKQKQRKSLQKNKYIHKQIYKQQQSQIKSAKSILSRSSQSSKNSIKIIADSMKQSKQSSQQSKQTKQPNQKKCIKILQPIFGKAEQKKPILLTQNMPKNIKQKQNIAYFFLHHYMRPKQYSNTNSKMIKLLYSKQQAIQLIQLAQQIIANQPMLLKVRAPLKIFGDIHGQFTDLMQFFNLYGTPHQIDEIKDIQNYDYIFLGDYVDRGKHSLQTILLLLALKVIYPKQIHLLRGNHQDININKDFGFLQECQQKMDEDSQNENSLYIRINKLFEWLPLGAVCENKILCIHGGIGKQFKYLHQIQQIKRPLAISHEAYDSESQIVLDILWSDPTKNDQQFGILPNQARQPLNVTGEIGNIVKFGPDIVQQFLNNNNLNMIVRAHQCVMDGFQRFAGGKLITLFSATDYSGRHKNAGGMLILKTNLQLIPKIIYPKNNNATNWLEDQVENNNSKQRPLTPPRWRAANH